MSVLYHPGKANVVVDTLSHITMESVSHVEEGKKYVVKDFHMLSRLGILLDDSPNYGFVVHHNSELSSVDEEKSKQHLDPLLM